MYSCRDRIVFSLALACLCAAGLAIGCSKETAQPSPAPPAASQETPAQAPPAATSPPPTAAVQTPAKEPAAVTPPVVAIPATAPNPPTSPSPDPPPAVTPQATPASLPAPASPAVPAHAAVGSEKCKMCHKLQYDSWGASKHASANPPAACETCHGNGADYVSMSVMKDVAKAKAAGLVLPGKDFCTAKCHKPATFTDDMLQKTHAHKVK